MYVNGGEVAMTAGSAGTYVAMPDMASTLRVGTADAHHVYGMLDEVRIYNRALSAAEVTTLFATYATTSTTSSTTVPPPVIVDMDTDVTLWAIYTPTGTITPMYSTNLGTMPIEWLPISIFTNMPTGPSNITVAFDPPDTNAASVFFQLRQTP